MTNARLGLAAGFLVVGALALRLAVGPRAPQPQTLSDGTVVRLAGLSYGKMHRIATGNFLQRTLGPVLPNAAAHFIGATIHSVTNKTDCLTAFFVAESSPRGDLTVSDDAGTELVVNRPAYQFAGAAGSNYICAFEIPMAGRLSRHLHLRLGLGLGSPTHSDSVEFDVRNPAPRHPSENPGVTLPFSTNSSALPFTLTGFAPFVRALAFNSRPNHWTAVNYTVPSSWVLADLSVRDSSGDSYHPMTWHDISPSERTFIGTFSSNQAWDLCFELQRLTDFSSNEVWTSPSFTLPDPASADHVQPIHMMTQLMGFDVIIDHVTERSLMISIAPDPIAAGYRPTFRLGNIEIKRGSTVMWATSRVTYYCNFNMPNPAEPTHLTVTLAPSQFVDVLARPVGSARPSKTVRSVR